MAASIDLRKAHSHRQHGDIMVVYSWIDDERAMFLIPAVRQRAPWYVIKDSAAYTWDDRDRANVPLVVQKLNKVCEVLGIEATPRNIQRLAAIIIDGIPELVQMPSAPPKTYSRAALGHMVLREGGKAIAGQDVRLEQEGVTYA